MLQILLSVLLIIAVVYATATGTMYVRQDSLIFPADKVDFAPREAWQNPAAQAYEITTPDGTTLRGIYYPAESEAAPLILAFPGNAHDPVRYATYLKQTFGDVHVLGINYRSYGDEGHASDGKPSQKAVLQDALTIYDHAKEKFSPSETYVFGYSLGSSIAAYLGSKRKLDGLVLTTPFDSMVAMGKAQYPWLPVETLLKHPFQTDEFMDAQSTPTAVILAEKDVLIPRERYLSLKPHIKNLILEKEVKGAGHIDVLEDEFLPQTDAFYHTAMQTFKPVSNP